MYVTGLLWDAGLVRAWIFHMGRRGTPPECFTRTWLTRIRISKTQVASRDATPEFCTRASWLTGWSLESLGPRHLGRMWSQSMALPRHCIWLSLKPLDHMASWSAHPEAYGAGASLLSGQISEPLGHIMWLAGPHPRTMYLGPCVLMGSAQIFQYELARLVAPWRAALGIWAALGMSVICEGGLAFLWWTVLGCWTGKSSDPPLS